MKSASGNGALSSGELADLAGVSRDTALSVGFTLDELAKVLKVRDAGGAPCEEVRKLAAQKLVNVQDQLRELTTLRDELQETLSDWDARLARRARGKRADLLESLSIDPKSAKRSHSIKRKRRSE
jgi:MerR, DNA binding